MGWNDHEIDDEDPDDEDEIAEEDEDTDGPTEAQIEDMLIEQQIRDAEEQMIEENSIEWHERLNEAQ